MKKFLKYFIKWAIRIVIICIILAGGAVYFLYNPSFIFDYEKDYQNIKIYSDSAIDDNFNETIERVISRVKDIEIFNPNYHPKIFLINDVDTYDKICFLSLHNSYTQAFNITVLGNIFVNVSRVTNVNLNHDPTLVYTLLEGKLDQVIAHEFVHAFIADRIGWITMAQVDNWKIEGYCEYASTASEIKKDKKADIIKRAKSLYNYDVSKVSTTSIFYYRAHLIVEYLAEVHHMTLDQLIESPADFDNLTKEFDEWYMLKTGTR